MTTLVKPEERSLLSANFEPSVLDSMEDGQVLDVAEAALKFGSNAARAYWHSVVTLIERKGWALLVARLGVEVDGEMTLPEPAFRIDKADRSDLTPRLLKTGRSQQEIADLFGVSVMTTNRDVSHSVNVELPEARTDSKGRLQPTRKKKTNDETNVQDAETVPLVACSVCGKERPAEQMTEMDDGPTCNKCIDDADEVATSDVSEAALKLSKSMTTMNTAVAKAVSALPLEGVTVEQATEFLTAWNVLSRKTADLRKALKQIQQEAK